MNNQEPKINIYVIDSNRLTTTYQVNQYFVFHAWNDHIDDVKYVGFERNGEFIKDRIKSHDGSHIKWILQKVKGFHKMSMLLEY